MRASLACVQGAHRKCVDARCECPHHPPPLESLGKFGTVVVDPPWTYTFSTRKTEVAGTGWHGPAQRHYSTMTLADLRALPVAAVAADDCVLALWSVNAMMRQAYELADAWGFEPKNLLTWAKVTKDGRPRGGLGRWLRGATEHLLIATKGKPAPLRRNQPSWFPAPPGAHSAKPDEAYAILETLTPGPRLDVFARGPRAGWAVWGDEAELGGSRG